MAGYSGAPLPKKLCIEGARAALVNAPPAANNRLKRAANPFPPRPA
ncbi:MAG TPA: hypothetical protein VF591_28905 [Pyrinomonadaceae bacterium]|jgi:hypothetical protein